MWDAIYELIELETTGQTYGETYTVEHVKLAIEHQLVRLNSDMAPLMVKTLLQSTTDKEQLVKFYIDHLVHVYNSIFNAQQNQQQNEPPGNDFTVVL